MPDDKVTDIKDRKKFDEDTKQMVSDAYERITELKAQRKAINEDISAIFSHLEGKGFNKKGLKAGFAYLDADDPQRQNFDNSYIFARVSGGVPLQNDLFNASMTASFLRSSDDDEGESRISTG